MASKDKVWIQNTYRSPIEIIIKDDNNNDEHFIFGMLKVDRITGTTVDDGYTVIEREDYDKLTSKSQAFNKLVKEGLLIVYNEAPIAAMSDIDRILALQEEVRLLKEENERLKKAAKSGKPAKADKEEAKAEDKE